LTLSVPNHYEIARKTLASVFNFDWSIAEIDWNKDAKDIRNLIKGISKPLSGAWTTIGKNKLYIWKAEITDESSIKNSVSIEPGYVFAINGKGLCVKCGKGSLVITDLDFKDNSVNPLDILVDLDRNYNIKLGN
jgi:methionyl-tRNA formyltransferase